MHWNWLKRLKSFKIVKIFTFVGAQSKLEGKKTETILDKIFQTNFSNFKLKSSCEIVHYRKSSILQVLAKFTFWEQDWALGYNFRKSWDFRGISQFPKILSLKSSGNSLGNSCLLLLLITMLYFTWSEIKIWNRSQQCKKLLSSKTLTSLICL